MLKMMLWVAITVGAAILSEPTIICETRLDEFGQTFEVCFEQGQEPEPAPSPTPKPEPLPVE